MSQTPELLTDGVVRFERIGRVAVITLNRPDVRNAVNRELSIALGTAIERFSSDGALRVAILRGAGTAFCAGQDLKALADGEPIGLPDHPAWGFAGIVRHRVDKPIIAAVHGYAFGGGLELALSCDLVVIGESARVGLPEVTLGLFAAAGGVPRIAQHVPPKIAAQLALVGAPVSAAVAERWGLVNEVVADDAIFDRALELASAIAANGPLGVQATKRILRDASHQSTWSAESWTAIQEEVDAIVSSDEAVEGIAAFLEKRPPSWA